MLFDNDDAHGIRLRGIEIHVWRRVSWTFLGRAVVWRGGPKRYRSSILEPDRRFHTLVRRASPRGIEGNTSEILDHTCGSVGVD